MSTTRREGEGTNAAIEGFGDLDQLFQAISREAVAKEQTNAILARWQASIQKVETSLARMERCMERVLVTMEVSNAYMAALLAKTPRERDALIETAEQRLADLNIHIEQQSGGTNIQADRDANTGDIKHGD